MKAIKPTAAAWEKCRQPSWMLWALGLIGYYKTAAGRKKIRRFMVACIRETPLGDGRTVFDLLTDGRSRQAVELAERMAGRSRVTEAERLAAESAAWAVALEADTEAARDASVVAARAAAGSASRVGSVSPAWWAASAVASWAAKAAATEAAREVAKAAQCDMLRRIVGNPFRTGRQKKAG